MYDAISGHHLASRWSRLLAALVDNLLVLPGFALFAHAMFTQLVLAFQFLTHSPPRELMDPLEREFELGVILLAGVLVIQAVHLSLFDQTLGKRAFRLRIVRVDGRSPSPTQTVLLRAIVPFLIGGFWTGFALGPVFGLIDALSIFRRDRRCIHDLLAGTLVVSAAS
jgi:uncharacterized RDD family membrane protein YckC